MNEPKVKEISETLFEVLSYSVKIQTKQGRKILLCSCQNSSRFANNNLCYHKQLVLNHINKKKIRKQINELITFYEAQREIKAKFDADVFLYDLNNLKNSLSL